MQLSSSEALHKFQDETPVSSYSFAKCKVPLAIFYGGKDKIADPASTESFISSYNNVVYSKRIDNYGHLDFILGKDIWGVLNRNVLKVLNDINKYVPVEPKSGFSSAQAPWEQQKKEEDTTVQDAESLFKEFSHWYKRYTFKKEVPRGHSYQSDTDTNKPESRDSELGRTLESMFSTAVETGKGGLKSLLDKKTFARLKERFMPTKFDDLVHASTSTETAQHPDHELSFDDWELRVRNLIDQMDKTNKH